MSITQKQREQFKKWSDAADKLSKEDQQKEAGAWIISAMNILNNKK